MALVNHILAHAQDRGASLALVMREHQVTYAALAELVGIASGALKKNGVSAGDRVVISASPTPTFVAAYLGTHLAGAVAVPMDPRSPLQKTADICERVDARLFIYGGATPNISREVVSLDELCDGTAAREARCVPLEAESPADILFTSGTTQRPKGVVLSHKAIEAAARNINGFIGNSSDDFEVLTLPLGHSFGLGRLRCTLLAGGTMVLLDGLRAPGQLFEAMSEWNVTGMAGVPATFSLIFRFAGDELGRFAEQLRYIEIGSTAMPIEDKKRLMRLLPKTRICMHYGLSEASRSAFIEFHESENRLDSIGKATPGVEIKLADHSGRTCSTGEVGRVLVRGPTTMTRYWNDAEGSKRAFDGDYLVTGDLGHADEKGYLFLDARESDIIDLGGRKVAPQEVEAAILEHPGVKDCACVGVADKRQVTGVTLAAFLVANPDLSTPPKARSVVAHLRSRLEPYKVPTKITWVTTIPRTESGKIQRHKLADLR